MDKWLKVDCSLGDSYVAKFIDQPVYAGGSISFDVDVVVPPETISVIAEYYGSALFFRSWIYNMYYDGIYLTTDDQTNWMAVTEHGYVNPRPAAPTDGTPFHLQYTVQHISGFIWHHWATIDGETIVDQWPSFYNISPTLPWQRVYVGGYFADQLPGEIYYLNNFKITINGSTWFFDDFEFGDTSSWDNVVGDVSVVDYEGGGGPGPTPPTNFDCANAETLSGVSGTVTGDNRGWDAAWPTGSDPLFNAVEIGGGAPLWYKWTNTTGQRVLFVVKVGVPADHVRDYNFGMIIADNCGDVVFNTYYPNMTFEVNEEFGAYYNGYEAVSNYGPYDDWFDIIVDPGHTVYFEIDSYTGITTEPPVADASHRGKFKFDWVALSYTTRDITTGSLQSYYGIPNSDILVYPVDPSTGDGIYNPIALERVGDRLFFLWVSSYAEGYTYNAGDCALDGSDFHSDVLIDTRDPPYANEIGPLNTPKLLTDGTDVFVGWAWRQESTTIPNPDCDPDTSNYPNICYIFGGCSNLQQFRYTIHKWNSSTHTWDWFYSIGQEHTGPPGTGYLSFRGDIGGGGEVGPWFSCVVCMSAGQPGVIWLLASYQTTRSEESYHYNQYPLFGCGSKTGSLYMTSDRSWLEETVDVMRIDVPDVDPVDGGGGTLVSEETNYVAEFAHWDYDHDYVNPVFGQWQWFSDGNWLTDPAGTLYPSIMITHMDLKNDDGFPILAYSQAINGTANQSDESWAFQYDEYLHIKRIDTDATLQTWTYGDVNLNFEILHDKRPFGIYLTERFFNNETNQFERGLSVNWAQLAQGYGGSYTQKGWLVRVPSDFSGSPIYLNPDDYYSSGWNYVNGGRPLTPVLFKDNRNGQWWAVGYSSETSYQGWQQIFLYDLCGPNWRTTYSSRPGDDFVPGWSITQILYWDKNNEDFYFLNQANQIRRAHVLRNYLICDIGEAVTPCPPSIFWFYRDGQWRQQNVDTEHSLWFYENGEWRQDCNELYGRLQQLWQN